jgi:hypothetical protein
VPPAQHRARRLREEGLGDPSLARLIYSAGVAAGDTFMIFELR